MRDCLELSEGYVKVLGLRVFYHAFGEAKKGTVVCLQGGPGDTHEYLLPMADLAQFCFRVVFFDPIGCGQSQRPQGTEFYTVDSVVDQADAVRRVLKLGRVHVMGNSWGGAFALVAALRRPRTIRSLTVSSGLASTPFALREMWRLVDPLPPDFRRAIHKQDAEGDFQNPAFTRAMNVFYRTHLCRLPVWPHELVCSFEGMSVPMNETMWGPQMLRSTGILRNWDITDQLPRVRAPTLVTVGKYDMMTPSVSRAIQRRIRGSKLVVFKENSHVAMWEKRDRFVGLVRDFLDGVH